MRWAYSKPEQRIDNLHIVQRNSAAQAEEMDEFRRTQASLTRLASTDVDFARDVVGTCPLHLEARAKNVRYLLDQLHLQHVQK